MVLSPILIRLSCNLRFLQQAPQQFLTSNRVNFSRSILNGYSPAPSKLLRSPRVPQIVNQRLKSVDHSNQWKLEKLLTVVMIPVIPATFIYPGTEILDNLFAILVTSHAHFGLSAIARDYVRPIVFGPLIPKIAVIVIYTITATTLGSILYFNHHNIGLGAAGRKIWSIGKEKQLAVE